MLKKNRTVYWMCWKPEINFPNAFLQKSVTLSVFSVTTKSPLKNGKEWVDPNQTLGEPQQNLCLPVEILICGNSSGQSGRALTFPPFSPSTFHTVSYSAFTKQWEEDENLLGMGDLLLSWWLSFPLTTSPPVSPGGYRGALICLSIGIHLTPLTDTRYRKNTPHLPLNPKKSASWHSSSTLMFTRNAFLSRSSVVI